MVKRVIQTTLPSFGALPCTTSLHEMAEQRDQVKRRDSQPLDQRGDDGQRVFCVYLDPQSTQENHKRTKINVHALFGIYSRYRNTLKCNQGIFSGILFGHDADDACFPTSD